MQISKIRNLLGLFCLLLGSFMSHAGIENYNLKVYDEELDFNGVFIYSIVQDDDGYLWISSDEGLEQFDGKKLVNLNKKDSVIDNLITASLVPRKGGVMFGYFKGGLNYYNSGKYTEIFNRDEIEGKIIKIEENQDDVYWALTQGNGIIRIKNGENKVISRTLLVNKISYDFEIFQDHLFIATNEGLVHFKITSKDQLKLVGTVKGTEHIPIFTLFTDHLRSRHAMWLGTEEHGLLKIDLAASTIKADHQNLLKHATIQTIAEDDYDNLWVGTRLNGLIKIDFNAFNEQGIQYTNFNKKNGFPANQINKIHVDRENEMWVGTFGGGLVQVSEKNILHYELKSKINVEGINGFCEVNPAEWLIASNTGLVRGFYEHQRDSMVFKLLEPLKGEKITALFHADDKQIYIGTDEHGLYKLSENLDHLEQIDVGQVDGLRVSIRYITEDKKKNLWVSIKGNGIRKISLKTGKVETFNTRRGFYHNEIYHVFPDSQGRIWFSAHSVGIALMDVDGHISFLAKEGEIPARDINSITEDSKGNIWIATYGQGVLKITGNKLTRYYEKQGLLSDYCNSIIVDFADNIWVSHRKGLSNINTINETVKVFSHKKELGENEVLINASFEDHMGDIWFGNPYGLTKINKPHISFLVKNLNTLISNLRIDYKDVDLSQFSESKKMQGFLPEDLVFPHDKNDLTFDFVAIHLKDPDAVHYQFKLDGYDDDWSPIIQQNFANYTNLPAGDYKFLVRESDNPNYWKEDYATVDFSVLLPYWKTIWFTAAELSFMGLLLFVAISLSRKIENRLVTKVITFISMFTVFEYVHTLVEPYVDQIAGGPAIFKVTLNLLLALALFPLENILTIYMNRVRNRKKLKREMKLEEQELRKARKVKKEQIDENK